MVLVKDVSMISIEGASEMTVSSKRIWRVDERDPDPSLLKRKVRPPRSPSRYAGSTSVPSFESVVMGSSSSALADAAETKIKVNKQTAVITIEKTAISLMILRFRVTEFMYINLFRSVDPSVLMHKKALCLIIPILNNITNNFYKKIPVSHGDQYRCHIFIFLYRLFSYEETK